MSNKTVEAAPVDPAKLTSPLKVPVVPETVPPVKLPANDVAVSAPVFELKVRLLPLLGARSPVAAVTNNGKHVVSLDSSATVTLVAVVTVPEKEPTNEDAVMMPEAAMLPLEKTVAPTPDVPKFT